MNVRPTRENVKYIGRAFEYDGNAILGFSGSGIEFVTCDETITINIAGDETAEKTEKTVRPIVCYLILVGKYTLAGFDGELLNFRFSPYRLF